MQCFLSENDCLSVGEVQISVLKIYPDSIRLGITDPQATPSYREEMLYIRNDDGEASPYENSYESSSADALRPFAISVL